MCVCVCVCVCVYTCMHNCVQEMCVLVVCVIHLVYGESDVLRFTGASVHTAYIHI